MLDAAQTVRRLVQIPSVNPMGRETAGEPYLEHRLTDFLQEQFASLGLAWERQPVAPLRENILARVEGATPPEEGGRLLLFEVHQDTVPVEGMTIEPFAGELREGRIYGRGACDIKGGMGGMLSALSRLAEERPADRPTVVLACTVNEEHGYTGAKHLAAAMRSGESKLLPRTPDAIIVAEPTLLNVVVAHKGVVRWRCRTRGRAAHSSQPEQGENAIYHMSRILPALERYAAEVAPTRGEHPRVGRPTLSVGVISGGLSVNTVPDECVIQIDRRVLPGEDPLEAWRHVVEYTRQHAAGVPHEHEEPFITSTGLSDEHNGVLAERLAEVARECGAAGEIQGVRYGTDAAALAGADVPAVVFGPGSIDQAHTKDEWVAVDQLEQAAEIYYQFAKRGMV